MIINFSPVQKFPIEDDLILIPLASGWQLRLLGNAGTPVYNFMKNTPQSGFFQYELKPQSSFSNYSSQGYTNLKVRGRTEIPQGDPNWLSVGSDWFPVANYTSTNQHQFKSLDIGISPPLTISQGTHEGKVTFHIEGVKNGITEVLSTYTIPVKLVVFEEGYFYDPSSLTFYFTQGNQTPSQQLQVGGDNWMLSVPEGLILTGSGAVQNPDGSYTATGSGLKTFGLELAATIDVLLDDLPEIVLPVVITYPNNSYTIPVTVVQAGMMYPETITFSIQNGQLDQAFRMIHLARTDAFTVEAPTNIGYELLETAEGKKIKVFVIDSSSYGTGSFPHTFKIHYNDATYQTTVIVVSGNQFDLGIDAFNTVFTRSMDDLVFSSANQDSILSLTLQMQGFSNSLNYKFPFFKGSAKKNIGNALSHFITSNKTNAVFTTAAFTPVVLNQHTLESITPIRYFDLEIKEEKGGNVLLNYNKKNVPFVLGYKPKVINGIAILQHNTISRYTRNSFALVSVFSQTGSFSYELLKNGTVVKTVNQLFGYIRTIKINFESYDAEPGDIFEFAMLTDEEPIKKSFVIVPDTNVSIAVVYEDSFGLLSVIDFTGNSKNINTEFDNKFELFHNQNFIHSRKHNEKEASTLILNTGYLLQSQQLEVAELMKSPKAWIVIDDERMLELIPKNKKMEEMSSDNFLYAWSVEFDVNKKEYAQDYHI